MDYRDHHHMLPRSRAAPLLGHHADSFRRRNSSHVGCDRRNRPPVFRESEIYTRKAFGRILAKRYFTEFELALLRVIAAAGPHPPSLDVQTGDRERIDAALARLPKEDVSSVA